ELDAASVAPGQCTALVLDALAGDGDGQPPRPGARLGDRDLQICRVRRHVRIVGVTACERGDSNPHGPGPLDPKSSASTSSASVATSGTNVITRKPQSSGEAGRAGGDYPVDVRPVPRRVARLAGPRRSPRRRAAGPPVGSGGPVTVPGGSRSGSAHPVL